MTKITTVLFDFDGVVSNTEPQYDIYFDGLGEKHLGISNLASQVKGITSNNMLERHFSHLPASDIEVIEKEIEDFEKKMSYPPVDGAIDFIHFLKEQGYNVGLVTSSQRFKMDIALQQLNLTGTFDIEITADDITEGKPNPMCYRIAGERLGVSPGECLVFEDSLFGVQAGKEAGMRVIGLSTTVGKEQLIAKGAEAVIPDFRDKDLLRSILFQAQ